jgi:flavin-dependent dehydrogenase
MIEAETGTGVKGKLSDQADSYDVAILGGGLAGLSLALQLKRQRPGTSVLVAEKRAGPAPEAAFKVGESTVEIAAHYFAQTCGMKDHIEREQLRKAGLRFFFPAGDNSDITARVEWGETGFSSPVPTYQLDRGRFENALAESCIEHGVEVRGGTRVESVEIDPDGHKVTLQREGDRQVLDARWVVDAAGRAFILKRKLGLEEDVEHAINSAWFRLGNGLLDHETWGAHDKAWMARMDRPGIRRHSTVHLTGEGYWVWLIPLASNSHSIGIVADPRFHPFDRINTLEAALAWLGEHEPQLAGAVLERRADVQDFLKIEKFSHGCKRVFSPDRWCLAGESGVFVDPLYSPGSDYIALGNMYAGDLITRDLDGEDVSQRVEGYNGAFLQQFNGAIAAVWADHYAEFGDAEVLCAKVTYDYVAYWGVVAPRVYYDKVTDLEFTQAVLPHFARYGALGEAVQQLFRDWHALGQPRNPTGLFAVTTRFTAMWDRLLELVGLDEETLRTRHKTNADILEGMAVVLFHKAARRLPDGPPDPSARINPYRVSLAPERWAHEGLFDETGLNLAEALERAPGFKNMLLDELDMARL